MNNQHTKRTLTRSRLACPIAGLALAWATLSLLAPGARAQNAAAQSTVAGAGVDILSIGEGQAASLSAANLDRADAVSLDVSQSALGEQSVADLRRWVRSGGVVFLHTDAARLFGYTTVEARAGTPRQGGQLLGRALAALPYTSHPLLWNDGRSGGNAASAANSPASAGVKLVFYRLRAGDHLVVQHPAAVPLLRVTDLAAANPRPLYAAAIAPYGRGWAVFTPFSIDANRADGALLARNFASLARSAGIARDALARPAGGTNAGGANASDANQARELTWVGVPADELVAAASRLSSGRLDAGAIVALCDRALGRARAGAAPNAEADAAAADGPEEDGPVLIAAQSEVAALRAAAAQEGPTPRVLAALCLMRARLAFQRSNLQEAGRWVSAASRRAPDAAEVSLWQGALLSAQAEPIEQSSRVRASLWSQCAEVWSGAARQPLLLGGDDVAPSRQALASWAGGAQLAAQLSSVEPPLVGALGRGASAITVRYYPNDPTLKLAIPFGAWMAGSAQRFGWRVEDEEVLIFPSPDLYQAYRAASGLTSTASVNPLGRFGDIQGERILMISQSTIIVPLPTGRNGQVRFVPLGSAVPSVLARLHALLLVNALSEDGGHVPNWMTLGLNGLAAISALNTGTTTNSGFGTPLFLNQFARAGLLLGPAQFEAVPSTGEQTSLAEAQASNMMAFFYGRFGAGSLVEALQRIGDGQSVDDALQASIGMSEEDFFRAWGQTIAPR